MQINDVQLQGFSRCDDPKYAVDTSQQNGLIFGTYRLQL